MRFRKCCISKLILNSGRVRARTTAHDAEPDLQPRIEHGWNRSDRRLSGQVDTDRSDRDHGECESGPGSPGAREDRRGAHQLDRAREINELRRQTEPLRQCTGAHLSDCSDRRSDSIGDG
jgi:hypothetical protein